MKQSALPVLVWRTSRYSTGGDNCVRWTRLANSILVGDSKNPDGPVIRLALDAWRSFLDRLRTGDTVDDGPLRITTGDVLTDGRSGLVRTVWHLWHPASGATLRFTAGEHDAFLREVRDQGHERTLAA